MPLAAADLEVPRFARAAALVWLAVYLPSYAWAYGWLNFLFLCNVGILLTAAGLLVGNRLLLSSQAIAAPIVCAAWALDVGWKVASGEFLFGGTSYMWDPQYPLATRLLSLYHVGWPFVLAWAVRCYGYDRRGFGLQAGLATLLIACGRLLPAETNLNWAYIEPVFGLALEPAIAQLALVAGTLIVALYLPTHLLLRKLNPARRPIPDQIRGQLT